MQFFLGSVIGLELISSWNCVWKSHYAEKSISLCFPPGSKEEFVYLEECNNSHSTIFGWRKADDPRRSFAHGDISLCSLNKEIRSSNYMETLEYLYHISVNDTSNTFSIESIYNDVHPKPALTLGFNWSSGSLWISHDPIFGLNHRETSPFGRKVLEGKFHTNTAVSYIFSQSLFYPATINNVNHPNSSYQCSHLREQIKLDGTIPFQIISDYFHRYSRDLLPHWLSYCEINIPTVHLREAVMKNLPPHPDSSKWLNNDYLHHIESTCIVKDIEQFESKHPELIKHHFYSKHFPLFCLEHFFQILFFDEFYPLFMKDFTNNSTETKNDEIVSQLELITWIQSNQLVKNKIHLFHEWLAVLRAVGNFNEPSHLYNHPPSHSNNSILLPHQVIKQLSIYIHAVDCNPTIPSLTSSTSEAVKKDIRRRNILYEKEWEESVKRIDNHPIAVLSGGEVYVIIFVMHYQVSEVQTLLYEWKRQCISKMCHLIVKYHIIPIHDTALEESVHLPYRQLKECLSSDNNDDCVQLMDNASEIFSRYYFTPPSFRSSYLELKRLLLELYAMNHMTIVLSGLHAVYSFLAPCSLTLPSDSISNEDFCRLSNANFFPPVKYGTGANYCLSSSIMTASAEVMMSLDGSDEDSLITTSVSSSYLPPKCLEYGYDPHAMIGVMRAMKMFFFEYLSDNYNLSERSDSDLYEIVCEALHTWEQLNPLAMSIDLNGRIFDMVQAHERMYYFFEREFQSWNNPDLENRNEELIQSLISADYLQTDSIYHPTVIQEDLLLNSGLPLRYSDRVDFISYLNDVIILDVKHLNQVYWDNLLETFLRNLPSHFKSSQPSLSSKRKHDKLFDNNEASDYCNLLKDFHQGVSDVFMYLLYKPRFFSLTVLTLKLILRLQDCLLFDSMNIFYLQAVYFNIVQLAKNAKHAVYDVTPQEFYLASKLLHSFREYYIYQYPMELSDIIDGDYQARINADNVTFQAMPPSTFSNHSSLSSPEITMNTLETLLQLCESAFLLESGLLSLNKQSFFQSLHPYLFIQPPLLSIDNDDVIFPPHPLSFDHISRQIEYWEREKKEALQRYDYRQRRIPRTSSFNKEEKNANDRRKPEFGLEIISYGSNMTDGMENLLFSSILSGVRVKVLGLGEPYVDYSTKMDYYLKYLMSEPGDDNDVILLVDAYDVILFPHIQKMDQLIYQSKTPILFCSEAGIYVEYAGAHAYYARGKYNTNHLKHLKRYDHKMFNNETSQGDDVREEEDLEDDYEPLTDPEYFINSGCIIGRRKEMKQLLSYTRIYNEIIRDDQQIMYRYHMLYPAMSSLDVFHDFSLTTFQQTATGAAFQLVCTFDLFYMTQRFHEYHPRYLVDPPSGQVKKSSDGLNDRKGMKMMKKNREYYYIGLVHSNNKYSNGFYHYFMSLIKHYYQYYYDPTTSTSTSSLSLESRHLSGSSVNKRITGRLLEAVWLVNDGQFDAADVILSSLDNKNRSLYNYRYHNEAMLALANKTLTSTLTSSNFPDTLIHVIYQVMAKGILFP